MLTLLNQNWNNKMERAWKISQQNYKFSQLKNDSDIWQSKGSIKDNKLKELWEEYKEAMQRKTSQAEWYVYLFKILFTLNI